MNSYLKNPERSYKHQPHLGNKFHELLLAAWQITRTGHFSDRIKSITDENLSVATAIAIAVINAANPVMAAIIQRTGNVFLSATSAGEIIKLEGI